MPTTSPRAASDTPDEMTSHFWLMTLFSGLVSVVFALLMREEPREQVRFGGLLWLAFVAAAVLLGWLMYPLPF